MMQGFYLFLLCKIFFFNTVCCMREITDMTQNLVRQSIGESNKFNAGEIVKCWRKENTRSGWKIATVPVC